MIKIKADQRPLTLVEVILLWQYYKVTLDSIKERGFNEKNNNHRIIEQRFHILDVELMNRSNHIEWEDE